MTNIRAFSTLAVASAFAVTGCTMGSPAEVEPTPTNVTEGSGLSVVVSTTILGDVVRDIVRCETGDDSTVTTVMPVGTDPHDFQPSSAQVAQMAAADLVVVNGLGLEEGLLPALESIEADGAAVLRVAAQLDPIVLGGGSADGKEEDHDSFEDHSEEEGDDDDHGHEEHGEGEADDDHGRDDDDAHEDDESDEEHSEDEGHDHDHAGGMDPHFWLDMDRMADAAELIGEELQSIAGGGFEVCGDQIGEKIESAERSVIEILDSVPEGQRVLVTDHDALEYFAQRYGYTVAGVVIPGGSTLGEPNSQELATLVGVIQDRDVPAIFGNNALGQDVLDVVAGEVGRDVQVVSLFIGSLGGPDSEATTYVQMMTTNATLIAQALTD